MREMLTHVDELVAAVRVDHTGSGGPDLSGIDQVKKGMYAAPPIQRDFVCLAPRGWVDLPGQGTLTGWAREYTIDVKGWARSTKDAPPERMAAAVELAASVQAAAQGVFLDEATPSDLYQVSHHFRIAETNVLDIHELGAQGPWGFFTMTLAYEVHGRDEVP